jgi:hypothetical protein
MNTTETQRILAVLKVVWPEREIDDLTVNAYCRALVNYPYAAVERAAEEWINTERWFPKPAELRSKIGTFAPSGLAIGSGDISDHRELRIFRTYDADLDDYVDLPTPIAKSDPRFAELMEHSRQQLREAGRRQRADATEIPETPDQIEANDGKIRGTERGSSGTRPVPLATVLSHQEATNG